MVGPPRIERPVERLFVVEEAVAAVERQDRRRNRRDERARAALDDVAAFARRDHDQLVAESGRGLELGVDIGPDTASGGGVKSAHVDDPHDPAEAGKRP